MGGVYDINELVKTISLQEFIRELLFLGPGSIDDRRERGVTTYSYELPE